mmetsp:Transcript_41008/g.123764  ORF Transcript_41008/g.123764 Transcript_41008/m.123764 type:complete len:119 (-) Transcript_41008:906-1262(-)
MATPYPCSTGAVNLGADDWYHTKKEEYRHPAKHLREPYVSMIQNQIQTSFITITLRISPPPLPFFSLGTKAEAASSDSLRGKTTVWVDVSSRTRNQPSGEKKCYDSSFPLSLLHCFTH